mmetsp:Transcript_95119/g.264299  ORF Transcript_95119/g.264299 Transcript_95119/m.264299 type:complete len:258 (-) Transcript_95119:34-807(-)
MEEFDDGLQKPDESGLLDMSHRAWRMLDETIWGWKDKIVILNISFNEIRIIPPELGTLSLLTEFNCSANQIQELPNTLGRLERLKTLKCNANKLDTLPDSIGDCKSLETIIATNNRIQELPTSMGSLHHLRTLQLGSNRLQALPLELCSCIALEVLDVTQNDELTMVPEEAKANNTKLVLWLCRQFQMRQVRLDELTKANNDLEHITKLADDEKLEMKKEMIALRKVNKKILDEEPRYYMACKRGIKGGMSRVCTIM